MVSEQDNPITCYKFSVGKRTPYLLNNVLFRVALNEIKYANMGIDISNDEINNAIELLYGE